MALLRFEKVNCNLRAMHIIALLLIWMIPDCQAHIPISFYASSAIKRKNNGITRKDCVVKWSSALNIRGGALQKLTPIKPRYIVNAAAAAVIAIVAFLQKPVQISSSSKSTSDEIVTENKDDKSESMPSAPSQQPPTEVGNDAAIISDTSAGVAWHALSGEHCLALLGSSANSGLSTDDSSQRLARSSPSISSRISITSKEKWMLIRAYYIFISRGMSFFFIFIASLFCRLWTQYVGGGGSAERLEAHY